MKKGTIIIEPEILADTRLTWLEKIMLARISGFCNSSDDGVCHLSAAELGEPMALTPRRSKFVISSLITKGIISRSWLDQNNPIIKLGGSVENVHPCTKTTPVYKNDTGSVENVHTGVSKMYTPSVENVHTPFYIRTKEKEIKNEDRTKTNACERVITETEMMFSEFWDAYPKKRDKKGAEKAFRDIKHLATEFPKIIRDVRTKAQSTQWKEQDGRFIPNPTTYIRQERWNDHIETGANEGMSSTQAEIERLRRKYGGVT